MASPVARVGSDETAAPSAREHGRGPDALGEHRDPTRIGRYALIRRLAAGGMGTVYLAEHRAAGGYEKRVAIKVVHPHLSDDQKLVRMFLDEARIAARIDHPNVATVIDFGEVDGRYYLAMEYLRGRTLSALLAKRLSGGALPLPVVARIVADAARGLHSAHELRGPDGASAGVVHRDVSPHNLFVTFEGATKVLDFGVARCNSRLAERTATGEVVGKPAYLSPEQLRRDAVDRRADVFALGIVLWECTVGRRLFRRDSPAATCAAVTGEPIPRPSTLVADYPAEVEAIVMGALERDPARRIPTADQIARALDDYLARLGQAAGPAQVGDFMRAHFDAEGDERDATASPREPTAPTARAVPTGNANALAADASASPAASAPDAPPAAPARVVDRARAEPARARATRRAFLGPAVLIAALCAVAIAAIASRTHRTEAPAPIPPPARRAEQPRPDPVTTAAPSPASEPVMPAPTGPVAPAAPATASPSTNGPLSPPRGVSSVQRAPTAPRSGHAAATSPRSDGASSASHPATPPPGETPHQSIFRPFVGYPAP